MTKDDSVESDRVLEVEDATLNCELMVVPFDWVEETKLLDGKAEEDSEDFDNVPKLTDVGVGFDDAVDAFDEVWLVSQENENGNVLGDVGATELRDDEASV